MGSHISSKIKQSSVQFFEPFTNESFDKVFDEKITTYKVNHNINNLKDKTNLKLR